MNRSPRFISLCIAVSAAAIGPTFAPSRALAQTASTSNEEAARSAFADGLRLRDEAKRPVEALPKFAEAYRLAATPITAYELGKTHMAVGNLLEAQSIFVSIGKMPPDPLQSARGKAARDDAKRLATELDSKIPSVAVKIEGVPPGEPMPSVTLDGKPLDPSSIGVLQRVNPGEHTFTLVRAKGGQRSHTVTTLEGKAELVTFDLGGGAKLSLDKKTVGLIVGGAGAVGIGLSLVLGASAAATNSSALDKHCGEAVGGRTANQCDFQGLTDIKSAGRRADMATVLFIVGGAALATGAVLWLTAPPAKGEKSVALGASLGGLHLQGGF